MLLSTSVHYQTEKGEFNKGIIVKQQYMGRVNNQICPKAFISSIRILF